MAASYDQIAFALNRNYGIDYDCVETGDEIVAANNLYGGTIGSYQERWQEWI